MASTTTYRYVVTLVELGYLKQGAGRRYELTLGLTHLGMESMNATSLEEHARPYLRELRQRTGLTASLAVLDGASLVYVERAWSNRTGRKLPPVTTGTHLPHNTALGKLLLAFLPPDTQRNLVLELVLSQTGPRTITSRRHLGRELRQILEDELAQTEEELAPGVVAIAVPVRDYSGDVVAAVSLAAGNKPNIDVYELADQCGPHLVAAADLISARLGYRRASDVGGSLSDHYRAAFEDDA